MSATDDPTPSDAEVAEVTEADAAMAAAEEAAADDGPEEGTADE